MGRDPARRTVVPVALRRMRVHPSVLAAVVLTVMLAASFAAALAAYSSEAGDTAVRSVLVDGTASTSVVLSGAVPQGSPRGATSEISAKMSSALGGVGVTVYGAPELESIGLPGSTEAQGRYVTLLGPDDLSAHASLVSGVWPKPANAASASGSASSQAPVPVALERSAASALNLSVGSVVQTVTATGAPAEFVVVGVFVPDDAQGPYWSLDPLGSAGEQAAPGYTTFGPFFTDPTYLAADSPIADGALAAQQMEWVAMPDVHRLGIGSLASAGTALAGTIKDFGEDQTLGNPASATQLPQLISGLATAALVAQSLLYAELLELLVVAVTALIIVVRLLTETREAEAALLWARGGTGAQLLRLRAVESLLLAAPAVVVAPLVARPLSAAIGRLGAGGGSALTIARLSGAAQAAVWTAVGAAAAGGIVVMLAPALGSAVSPVTLRARRGRQAAVTAIGRAGFDLALLALAVVASWQSAEHDSIVTLDQSGTAGYDPVAIAAPALVLAAGAVVVLRLLPFVARLCNLAARRARSLTLPLALWQTGRKPLKLGGLVLLTMLSVAAGVLSLSEYASAGRSAADQAAFTTGSDVDVRLPGGQLAPAALAALGASPGVRAVTAFSRDTYIPSGTDSQLTTLLALDPAGAARTVILRPDLSPVPLSTLMSDLARPASVAEGVPAVATRTFADALGLAPGSVTSVSIGSANLPVRIVAIVSQFPTISTPGGGLVVDIASANALLARGSTSGAAALLAPDELWLRDGSATPPRGLPPGSVVTFRTELQGQLRSAPLAEEPMQALLALAAATALLALCGMAVGVLAASGERSGELALLDALGLSRRGRIGLLCVEQALVAIPGALAGLALGLFLGRLVIPAATLTADAAKPQPPVAVLTPWTPVALGVAGILVVPLIVAVLAGARRGNTASVLREGADR